MRGLRLLVRINITFYDRAGVSALHLIGFMHQPIHNQSGNGE